MKNSLKTYFNFSKKELNGVFILCLLLTFIALSPIFYQSLQKPKVYHFNEFEKEIQNFEASAYQEKKRYPSLYDTSRITKVSYFKFDPNGLDESEWKKLGLSNRQIQVIKNYESKGGKFYSKEDVKKMYCLKPDQYTLLEPYIFIKSTPNNRFYSKQETIKKASILVNVNQADSTELETIRGIGPSFASRIIKYRTRLGGFYKKEQLQEIYGLDSIKYEEIKNQVYTAGSFKKININTFSFDELKKHPYLSYKQINAILEYRKQHGNYENIEDLAKVILLDQETLKKISAYISF